MKKKTAVFIVLLTLLCPMPSYAMVAIGAAGGSIREKVDANFSAIGTVPEQSGGITEINVHIQMPFSELNREIENTVNRFNDYIWTK